MLLRLSWVASVPSWKARRQYSARLLEIPSPVCCQNAFATLDSFLGMITADMIDDSASLGNKWTILHRLESSAVCRRMNWTQLQAAEPEANKKASSVGEPWRCNIAFAKASTDLWIKNLNHGQIHRPYGMTGNVPWIASCHPTGYPFLPFFIGNIGWPKRQGHWNSLNINYFCIV